MLRLNKYISDSGLCSRRVADRYIEKGLVFINGRRAVIGDKVSPKDVVKVNGQEIEAQKPEDFILLAYNKPVGVTCTTELNVKGNIVEHVNHSARLFPIGRLDKDSQGLIFMTNNGDIVNKMLRAGNNHEKEYIVTVDKAITEDFLEGMSNGVPILGVMTKKCKITQESANVFRIILVQGLNRQIRRMSEHFGYEVTRLERVRIMNIRLKGLPLGDWRDLDEQEIKGIFSLIEESSSSEKPKKAKTSSSIQAKPSFKRKGSSERHSTTQASRGGRLGAKSASSSKPISKGVKPKGKSIKVKPKTSSSGRKRF
jgi:23S rRNA pseudouridine2604 synthase